MCRVVSDKECFFLFIFFYKLFVYLKSYSSKTQIGEGISTTKVIYQLKANKQKVYLLEF